MTNHAAKLCFVTLMTLATANWGELKAANPQKSASLQNLDSDAVHILRKAPHVAEAKRHGPSERPTRRIVHLADWHFVERGAFADDLRSLSDTPISDEDIDRYFAELLDEVEGVQRQQMAFLRWLIEYQGLNRVYIEGLTKRDTTIIAARIRVLQDVGRQLDELRPKRIELLAAKEPSPKEEKIIAGIAQLEQQYRCDLLQLGAAGRLVLSGELDGVLPLEDEQIYQNANPVGRDGTVIFDQKTIEAREDGQVRQLLEGGPLAVLILGGAHDLANNIDRLLQGKGEYIRVELTQWEKVAGEVHAN